MMRGVDVLGRAIDAALDDLLAALDVRPSGVDCFVVEPTSSGRPDRVFGGQLLAQAVVGACGAGAEQETPTLHASFLRAGTPGAPLKIQVTRLRDGRSIAVREVAVLEAGEP